MSSTKQHRGRAVVDDEPVLGTGNLAQHLRDRRITRTALARFEIVLEIRIPPAKLRNRRERIGAQRRAAKIRVQNNPGRVDDRPLKRREAQPLEIARERCDDLVVRSAVAGKTNAAEKRLSRAFDPFSP